MNNNYDIKLKYILLGDAGVGKTSIIQRQKKDDFSSTYLTTIGVDYINLNIKKNNYNFNIAVWDTAGQEKFKNIINVYYRAITAAIIVYDITSLNSFTNVYNWIDEIREQSPNCYIMIVGNKIDLGNQRQVFPEHIKTHYKNYYTMECSSKDNININSLFETLTTLIYEDIINNKIKFDDSNGIQVYKDKKRISTFKIEEEENVPNIKKNKGCCFIL